MKRQKDFRVLGRMLENQEHQLVFSSILPVTWGDFGRNRRAQDLSTWLQNWYTHQNFVFLNNRRVFKAQGMFCRIEQIRIVQLEVIYNDHLEQLPHHFRAD